MIFHSKVAILLLFRKNIFPRFNYAFAFAFTAIISLPIFLFILVDYQFTNWEL